MTAAGLEADNGINKWIGLDLGKPVEISKIRFLSRNDKNTIIPGNLYELFYWDSAKGVESETS